MENFVKKIKDKWEVLSKQQKIIVYVVIAVVLIAILFIILYVSGAFDTTPTTPTTPPATSTTTPPTTPTTPPADTTTSAPPATTGGSSGSGTNTGNASVDYLTYFDAPKIGDYPANDITCGKYTATQDIAKACYGDVNCKGFTVRSGIPWCMKNKEDSTNYSAAATDHQYYHKK
jgi:hypothetical protein